jgi:hypothetical protein
MKLITKNKKNPNLSKEFPLFKQYCKEINSPKHKNTIIEKISQTFKTNEPDIVQRQPKPNSAIENSEQPQNILKL